MKGLIRSNLLQEEEIKGKRKGKFGMGDRIDRWMDR